MYMTPRRPVRRRLVFSTGSAKRFKAATPAFTPAATDGAALSGHRTLNKTTGRAPSRKGTLTQQVKSLQSWVAKHKPEVKYFDYDVSNNNLTSAGLVLPVDLVAQGATGITRTGSEINVTSVSLRCNLIPNTDSTSRFYHRVLLVLDKEGASLNSNQASSIFTDAVYTANPISLLPNLGTLERFRILACSELKDNGMGFNANVDTGATQSNVIELNWRGNLKITYQAGSTTSERNGIYVVFLTNSTAGTVDWAGVSRMAFTDA